MDNSPQAAPPSKHLEDELFRFQQLQALMGPMFARIFSDRLEPRTVVVAPSLSMNQEELAKITGVHHYEERLLCLLMLLQLPRTRLIFVTSQPIHPTIIDYYLHLLPGIPTLHARQRLILFCCYDATPKPLTQKILERPRLLQRIQSAIPNPRNAHLTCFNASSLERTLAVKLGIPLYAADPALTHLGTKSNSRLAFRKAGIPLPDGFENLRDATDIVDALHELKVRHPHLLRAVVKLNDGFSGEGNAIFPYHGYDKRDTLKQQIAGALPERLRFEAAGESWDRFAEKFSEMGGIVEAFIDGQHKQSPSVQCRINPLGKVEVISTHDQILGGPSGQIFLGCTFPAGREYRLDLQEAGIKVGRVLRDQGVIGRFGIDFISVPTDEGWRHYAIEINLRKGGTTHPYMMLQYLTNGTYDINDGLYRTPGGQTRYYYASDNLQSEGYLGLTPDDLMDIAVYHNLHFHGARQEGVVFHLIGALSEYGKLGVVCIGNSLTQAKHLYDGVVDALGQINKTPVIQ